MTTICAFLLLGSANRVAAQYTITAYPPANNFMFDDLWHFTVNGPASGNYKQFYVALRVYNEQGGLVIKSNSSPFEISAGVLYINKSNLTTIGPLTTLFYDNVYQQIVNTGDFFPSGNYNVVLNLLGRPTDGEFTEVAENNFSVAVQVFMPPILIFPEDKAVVETQYPLLSWLPAYHASTGQQILYHIYLTEIFEGQTPLQSITANPVYFEQFDLPMTAITYPPGANEIRLNHTYAWQVAATVNGIPVGYSQVWQFTYRLPEPVETTNTEVRQFYSFFENLSGAVVPIYERAVRIRVDEAYLNEAEYLAFRITNAQNKVVASSDALNIQVITGVRFVEIPLCGDMKLDKNQEYLIEVTNAKKQARYMRIKVMFDRNQCD